MSITTLLIIATATISVASFERERIAPESMQRPEWNAKLKFNAYLVWHKRQYYRLLSHGLVHANLWHLLFNMMTLYFFGDFVEQCLSAITTPGTGKLLYIVLYVSALIVSSSLDLARHKDNIGYNAVGASGAVSAIIFASIIFNPMNGIGILFIPVRIPGYIFGLLYLAYCIVMDRKNIDNIGHSAHLMGAVYGLAFPILVNTKCIDIFLSYFK